MSKMLITEALDERDYLKIKIRKDINRLNSIDVKSNDVDKIKGQDKEEFIKNNASLYQSIVDRIERLNKINIAITQSNAVTKVTVNDTEYTVAQAIAIKTSINNGDNLLTNLYKILDQQYTMAMEKEIRMNRGVEEKRLELTNNLVKSEKELTEEQRVGIEEMIKPYKPDVVVAVEKKELDKLEGKLDGLAAKLNTAIKISNATTYIEL